MIQWFQSCCSIPNNLLLVRVGVRTLQFANYLFSPDVQQASKRLRSSGLRARGYQSCPCQGLPKKSRRLFSGPPFSQGTKHQMSTKISHSASKAQYKGDTRNSCFVLSLCLYSILFHTTTYYTIIYHTIYHFVILMFMWSVGVLFKWVRPAVSVEPVAHKYELLSTNHGPLWGVGAIICSNSWTVLENHFSSLLAVFIEDDKKLIFTGPPRTAKTWLSRRVVSVCLFLLRQGPSKQRAATGRRSL